MTNQIQLSGDAIAGIIWFVIFVIWGIGKLLASLREQKIRREYDRRVGESDAKAPGMEDQLRNFLETLTGEELPPWSSPQPTPPKEQAPPPPAVEPERPARVSPYGAFPTAPRVSTPQFQHRQHGSRGRRASARTRAYNPLLADAGKVAGVENVVEKVAAGAALPGHEYMLGTRNDGMRLPMFGLQLPDPDKENRAVHRYRIRGVDDLRRAMMDRIVLGPPRGMSPRMPCEDQRQV